MLVDTLHFPIFDCYGTVKNVGILCGAFLSKFMFVASARFIVVALRLLFSPNVLDMLKHAGQLVTHCAYPCKVSKHIWKQQCKRHKTAGEQKYNWGIVRYSQDSLGTWPLDA